MNLLIFNLKTDADDSVLGFTTDWINAIAERCDRTIVITMMTGRLAVADNVQVFSVGKEKGYSERRRLWEFYRLLWQVLQTEQIDACFAHMMPLFAILGWPLLKLKQIPIVLWYAHRQVTLKLRLATALVDRVVASSASGFRIRTHKFRSIGQGIDTDRFCPPEQTVALADKSLILTVGRLSPIKRLEVLIEAVALLPEALRSQVELRYVGDPLGENGQQYAQQLHAKVATLGLTAQTRFEPAHPFHQVQRVYQQADIFVNSSDTDSMDKTVLEAMSCGVPVVTSNAAFRDVFSPELAADWLISKNDPALLAQRLTTLLKMGPTAKHALGLQLRALVKRRHSLPALVNRLLNDVIAEVYMDQPVGPTQKLTPFGYVRLMVKHRRNPLHVAYLEGHKVLDVGCGEGHFLRKDRANRVGVDIDGSLVERCAQAGLDARVMSATELSFPEATFDAVHAAELIEHLEPAAAVKFLQGAAHVLRPGGLIYLTTPGLNNVWNTFSHVRPYPPIAFKKLLEKSTEGFINDSGLPLRLECSYAFSSTASRLAAGIKKSLNMVFPPAQPSGYVIILRKLPANEQRSLMSKSIRY